MRAKRYSSALIALLAAALLMSVGNAFLSDWLASRGWYNTINSLEENYPLKRPGFGFVLLWDG